LDPGGAEFACPLSTLPMGTATAVFLATVPNPCPVPEGLRVRITAMSAVPGRAHSQEKKT